MNNKKIFLNNLSQNLLNKYGKYMYLKIFVDDKENETNNLKSIYQNASQNHNLKIQNDIDFIDAGFDLYIPASTNNSKIEFTRNKINKVDFKIKCASKMYTDNNKEFNTGYYMYPRSSISKTDLRLANSTGIVDAGYRGNLIGMFDVLQSSSNQNSYYINNYDRLIQICAPGFEAIIVEIVDNVEDLGVETQRGEKGIGSSGK